MRQSSVVALSALIVACANALPVRAEVTASTLIPITAPDYLPQTDPPALATNLAGRVMVVYLGRGPDDKWGFFSVLQATGGWQQSALPMPAGATSASSLKTRHLIAGQPAGGYHFAGSWARKVYYWHWQNGHWSQPELVTDDGASGTAIALDPTGEPLIARSETRFRFYRKVAGQWEETKLSTVVSQKSLPSLVTGARGVPHLLGVYRRVPIVATLPLGRNPTVEANWAITPDGDRHAWTSGIPDNISSPQLALDWPHHLVYAAWHESKSTPRERKLQLAWAPVGAVREDQWQSATVDLPASATISRDRFRLASDGYGHVALAYHYRLDGDPSLHFRWLDATGPGPELDLIRPGTQTEACVFSSIASGTLNLCFDHSGKAHVVVRAVKRGEVPANTRRLFYATVSGGGPDSTEDPHAGTTTAGGDIEGAKPDFTVALIKPDPGENLRLRYNTLRPRVEITNHGAQYYGDLWLEATLDNAQVRIRIPDTSEHRKPLFDRGKKRTLYLPRIRLDRDPGPAPAALTYDYPRTNQSVHLATGLGRKLITVAVDPDNQVDEANEDNNGAQVEYIVYDGSNKADREKVGGKTIYGLNDLALAQPPQLKSNTLLWRAGYMQRPTHVQLVVSNPGLADFFQEIPVAVFLDNQELARSTIALLDDKLNLWSGSLAQTIVYGAIARKPDLSAAVLDFPVDLTAVAEGNHQLRVVIDPDDKFADRRRANNAATINFKVRGPGGTLRVRVVDMDDGTTPIAKAVVSLRDLWAQLTDATGVLEIPDVPPGAYDNKAIEARRTGADPRFYPSCAPACNVAANQTTTVTLPLEKAVIIVGDVFDTSTDALLAGDTVGVALQNTDFYHPTYVTGPHYQILDVPPGEQTVRAGAYSFLPAQVTQEVHRGPQGECRVDLSLQPGPRAIVEGTVLNEANGRPLAGASV